MAANDSEKPEPPATASDSTPNSKILSPHKHLSETIRTDHWLRLLVVLATILLMALIIGVAVHLLAAIGHTLLIFSLGGLLAYALEPFVGFVRVNYVRPGKRRSRAASALAVYLVLFGLLGAVGLSLSATLFYQAQTLAADHETYENHARERLADADNWLVAHNIHVNLSGYLRNPPPNVKSWGEAVAHSTLGVLEHVSRDIVEGFIVVLISLYFLIYCEEMRRGIDRALPEPLRAHFDQWQDDVNRILGGFVRGQLTLALIIGALAAAICFALGLRLWLLIGLFVVFASLIPVAGPIIGAIPAIIAALASPHAHFHPVARVVLLVFFFFLMNEFGSKILYPKLVGGALGLHEVLVLFILLAGLEVGGLVGVLFAAPLTALSIVTAVHVYRLWQGLPPVSVAQAAKESGQRAKAHGVP